MSYPNKRSFGSIPYRKKIVVSTEGACTEPEYLTLADEAAGHRVILTVLSNRHRPCPHDVLARIAGHRQALRPGDELWCVIDKDSWTEAQLSGVYGWAAGEATASGVIRRVALSNPKFELWLLLHFEGITGPCGASECVSRLKKHLPDYDKHLSAEDFPMEKIRKAIAFAEQAFGHEVPLKKTGTNVHLLVTEILSSPA